MIKAVREAKVASSWAKVNAAYEEGLSQFIQSLLESRSNAMAAPGLPS